MKYRRRSAFGFSAAENAREPELIPFRANPFDRGLADFPYASKFPVIREQAGDRRVERAGQRSVEVAPHDSSMSAAGMPSICFAAPLNFPSLTLHLELFSLVSMLGSREFRDSPISRGMHIRDIASTFLLPFLRPCLRPSPSHPSLCPSSIPIAALIN